MMFSCLQARLAAFSGRFNVFVGTSHRAAQTCKPEIADFIFIDASHVYAQVDHDIEVWWPILKPGGILAGHDFDKPIKGMPMAELEELQHMETIQQGYHPGVVRAVRERFDDFELAPDENSSIWWGRKPNALSATLVA